MQQNFSITNELIIARLKSKDKAFFEQIFREHYEGLVAFATRYVQATAIAEDVVQEVFYKIWNRADTLNINTSLKSYLFGAVRNACLNYLKHQKVEQAWRAAELAKDQFLRQDDALELDELKTQIDQAIDSLPERCRAVFLLSRYEDKSYKEIAAQLDISVKTVENQMGKALKQLREALGPYVPLLIFIQFL